MKVIDSETLFRFKYVSDPLISPSGKYTSFIVRQPDKEMNDYKANIYLLDNDTRNVRRLTAGGDAKMCVWTLNDTILFPSNERKKVSPRSTQFYEIDPKGGEALESFNIPLVNAKLILVPNCTKYAVIATFDNNAPDVSGMTDEEAVQALDEYENSPCYVFDEVPFWANGLGVTNGQRQRLYIYDAETGVLTPVTGPFEDVSNVRIDNKRILYMSTEYGKNRAKPRYKGVYLYDMIDGSIRCLIPDDTRRIDAVEFIENDIIVATTEGETYCTEQYCDFYILDEDTCKLRKIADYGYSVNFGSVGSDARLGDGQVGKTQNGKFYFITTIGNSAILRSVDRKGEIIDVSAREGSVDSFDICGDRLIICGMYGDKLAELYDGMGQQLTNINAEFYSEYQVSTPEFYSFINSDDIEIHGWAIKPIGYKEGEKYPAILDIHGGPRRAFGSIFFHEMQCWAAAGYFVLFCNPRGGDGRGHPFGYISGEYGTGDYRDVMEFTDEMLKKYADIDPERLGVAGGSYGGFMTNWIIGHTGRFKAAASQRSICDWVVFEHTSDVGYLQTKSQHLTTTREDVGKLWEFSPLKYADKAITPTLFIHSNEDYRCNMIDGISMYSALKRNGVDTRLCLFKGESHELSRSGRPKARIRRMHEILTWMDSYLK